MATLDAIVPLLLRPWPHPGENGCIVPLPGVQPNTVTQLESHWSGFLTEDTRRLLELSCGLSATPLGQIDFTGKWYPEEPLSQFRPSLTLAIDENGRRWIAEVHKTRGLPGPIWCIAPAPRVALYLDANLAEFLLRLREHIRRGTTTQWLTNLTIRARRVWAQRFGSAMTLVTAWHRLREIRGWLGTLPRHSLIYDLRAPTRLRGLPYNLGPDFPDTYRCGKLPVFAISGFDPPDRSRMSGLSAARYSSNRGTSTGFTRCAPKPAS